MATKDSKTYHLHYIFWLFYFPFCLCHCIWLHSFSMVQYFFNLILIGSLWLCCYTNSSWPQSWKWRRAALGSTYQVTAVATHKSYLHYFLFGCKAFVGKLPVAGRVTLDWCDNNSFAMMVYIMVMLHTVGRILQKCVFLLWSLPDYLKNRHLFELLIRYSHDKVKSHLRETLSVAHTYDQKRKRIDSFSSKKVRSSNSITNCSASLLTFESRPPAVGLKMSSLLEISVLFSVGAGRASPLTTCQILLETKLLACYITPRFSLCVVSEPACECLGHCTAVASHPLWLSSQCHNWKSVMSLQALVHDLLVFCNHVVFSAIKRHHFFLHFGTVGSDWSPEGHSGVSAGGGDPASGQGDHRSGRREAAGGGQPSVRLRLAGNAQPRNAEGERKNLKRETTARSLLSICPGEESKLFVWWRPNPGAFLFRWWRPSRRERAAKPSTGRRRPTTTPASATWGS